MLKMTPKLLKLSIAAGEDLRRVPDIVTDYLDTFGLKLDEVDRFMDRITDGKNG
nr:phage tail tape measure protein [Fusobacterium necrophorum]